MKYTYTQVRNYLQNFADQYQFGQKSIPTPFKGTNFVTDQVVSRFKMKNGLFVELSFGKGIFNDDYVYGVTIQTFDHDYTTELGGLCHTFEEVDGKLIVASEYKIG